MRLLKTFLVISILLFSSLEGVIGGSFCVARGGSFSTLWKQYNKAMEKDQPVSALAIISKIEKKAEAERNYGALMTAWMKGLAMQKEVSPDSFDVAIKRLEEKQKVLRTQDRVASTLLDVALYKNRYHFYSRGKSYPKISIDSLLHSPDSAIYVKANRDAAYTPFSEVGVDSKYFNHDLLHLIGYEVEDYWGMYEYYRSVGNERAAAILDAQMFLKDLRDYSLSEKKKIEYIDSVLTRWKGWDAMDMLRQERAMLQEPFLDLRIEGMPLSSSDSVKAFVNARNIKGIKIKMSRVNLSPEEFTDGIILNDEKGEYRKKIIPGTTVTAENSFPLHPDYEHFSDTLTLAPLPIGFYLIEMADSEGKMQSLRKLINVSDLRVISQRESKNGVRCIVVDAATGHPVPEAKLHIQGRKVGSPENVFSLNSDGEYVYEGDNTSINVWATTENDKYLTKGVVSSYFNQGIKRGFDTEKLFTDRRIYRPGQTVNVAVVAYSLKNDGVNLTVRPDKNVVLTILDRNRKVIRKDTLRTDEYGTAAMSFVVPENVGNGTMTIRTQHTTQTIRVEEYVRPTYDVTIDKPTIAYHDGDTITVSGKATTYSGVPVTNARVIYEVKRRPSFWLRNMPFAPTFVNYHSSYVTLAHDTIETSADGSFQMRMPMVMPESQNKWLSYFYDIFAEATVTDIAGESHSSSLSLPLSNRESFISCDLGDKILADSVVMTTVNRYNIAGTKIDGTVRVFIDGKHKGEYEANKPFALTDNLPSGKHALMAICESDTLKNDFFVFRLSDEHPVSDTHDWWYQSATQFTEDGEIAVQFGSSDRNVRVYYSLFDDNKLIEKGTIDLDSALCTRRFSYKEEYGDGLTYTVAWMKNGLLYTHNAQMKRPLPDMKLKMEWGTFRNKVVPGSKEEWTLRILNPDGTPAKAQMMATLYDKSLDAIVPFDWKFQNDSYLALLSSGWYTTPVRPLYMPFAYIYPNVRYHNLAFSHLTSGFAFDGIRVKGGRNVKMMRATATESKVFDCVEMSPMLYAKAAPQTANMDVVIGYAGSGASSDSAEEENEGEEIIPIRENLDETAFFMPQLVTDENGMVSLRFTLPESVTTWHFLAFAHDKQMRNGMMRDEAIAQKKLMVQPRMPRFLREGDKASISASVANLSGKDQSVKVTMKFTDEETGKVISTQTKKVTIKAGTTESLSFAVVCEALGGRMLICTTTASCKEFSDGEQHRLPVLTDMERIVNTYTYMDDEQHDVKKLVASLTPKGTTNVVSNVEHVDHPEQLMLNALPTVKGTPDNAVALVSAYYANTVSAMLKQKHATGDAGQEVSDDVMPSDSLKMLMTRLLILQHNDGSWSWWKGMSGSRYVTMYVLKTLLRLNAMVGERSETEQLIRSSLRYVTDEVAKDIAVMKKNEKQGAKPWLSQWCEDYLYCLTLLPSSPRIVREQKAADNHKYLMKYLVDSTVRDDMASKANASLVLDADNRHAKAKEYIESIVQHTVYRKDMGRYFDTYRADNSWCDYRIPTQVAVIEALKGVTPDASQTTISEMQRWLLQSKRTQSWDNPVNTVNAVYAFADGKSGDIGVTSGSKAGGVSAASGSKALGWTNVSVAFDQKISDVENASTGLKIKRELSSYTPKVGDRVKVRITITADRDYDFVTVSDKRAACLEPVSQLSGYANGAYKELHDTETKYYYDMLPKGVHVIETEYYATRSGIYTTGVATVQSTYAPEFCGRAVAKQIEVKP